jgi:hypothetical protein
MGHDTTLIMKNTPQCLRILPQWLVWRNEEVKGRLTKVPYDAKTGRKASSTDPATWTTFEQAVEAFARSNHYDGIGFVFTRDDPFCGIDLDDCVDENTNVAPWAQAVMAQFHSYTEISPSGTGVKIFLRGRKPDFADCSAKDIDPDGYGELELYDHARYFAVTGDLWPGSATDVADCQAALDVLCQRLWRQPARPSAPTPAREQAAAQSLVPAQVHSDDRVGRCLAAMLKMNVADRNDGSHRLFAAACRCVEHDLTDAEAVVCLRAYAALKPFPAKWTSADLVKRLRDAERSAERGAAVAEDAGIILPAYKTVGKLLADYPDLRRPTIHGLLREGETGNLIAASKKGKSWLAVDLALAVATGRPWLGTFQTARGKVLILDNELHGETSADRIPKVAEARLIPLAEIADQVCVENMRGRLVDLFQLESYFGAIEPGTFTLVILDAFYRFIPKGTDENDNGTVAQLYNHIDRYAQHLGCSFVLIHHASKGNQSSKAVTDVGAGAGSQSRAADTHLILRPHQQDGVVVLDAAVRSWPPVSPMCLEWACPVWNPVSGLDPADLRPERPRRKPKEESKPPVPAEPPWDTEKFVGTFIITEARPRAVILEAAEKAGLSERRAETFLKRAVETGRAFPWRFASNQPVRYATIEQPLIDMPVSDGKRKRKRK